MAIAVVKKKGSYTGQAFTDKITVLQESNIKPIDSALRESTDSIVNQVFSFPIVIADWEEVIADAEYKVVVNHNFNSQLISGTFLGAEGQEACSIKIISNTSFEVYNDRKVALNSICCVDLI